VGRASGPPILFARLHQDDHLARPGCLPASDRSSALRAAGGAGNGAPRPGLQVTRAASSSGEYRERNQVLGHRCSDVTWCETGGWGSATRASLCIGFMSRRRLQALRWFGVLAVAAMGVSGSAPAVAAIVFVSRLPLDEPASFRARPAPRPRRPEAGCCARGKVRSHRCCPKAGSTTSAILRFRPRAMDCVRGPDSPRQRLADLAASIRRLGARRDHAQRSRARSSLSWGISGGIGCVPALRRRRPLLGVRGPPGVLQHAAAADRAVRGRAGRESLPGARRRLTAPAHHHRRTAPPSRGSSRARVASCTRGGGSIHGAPRRWIQAGSHSHRRTRSHAIR
jgi:hypothetical protein